MSINLKDITSIERYCLTLVAEGQTTREIAIFLTMAEGRIEHHLNSIETKLGAASRVEAVAIALKHNFLQL